MPALEITQAGDADLGLIRAVAGRPAGQHRAGPARGGAAALRTGPAGAGDGRPVYGVNTGHGGAVLGAPDRAAAAFAPAQPAAGPGDGRAAVAGPARGPGGHHGPAADVPVRRRRRVGRAVPAARRLPQLRHRARRARGGRRARRARSLQLAHAFGPLAGIGRVLGPGGALRPGRRGAARSRADRVQPGPEGGHRPDRGSARGHRPGRAAPRRGRRARLADGGGRGAVDRGGPGAARSVPGRLRPR